MKMALNKKILQAEYDNIPPCYSPELQRLVEAMLSQNPEDRPSVTDILRLPSIKRTWHEIISQTNFKEAFAQLIALEMQNDLDNDTIIPANTNQIQKKLDILAIQSNNQINIALSSKLDSYLERLTKFEKNKRVEKEKPINCGDDNGQEANGIQI